MSIAGAELSWCRVVQHGGRQRAWIWTSLIVAGLCTSPSSAHADVLHDHWSTHYSCARVKADSAYQLAADSTGGLLSARGYANVARLADEVEHCVSLALALRPEAEVRDRLLRLSHNLARLSDVTFRIGAFMGSPARDSVIVATLHATDSILQRRPISETTVWGVVRALGRYADISLEAEWSVRVGELHDEFLRLRDELDRLAASRPWTVGVSGSGYEGNVLGVGGMVRIRRDDFRLLIAPSLLADTPNGWRLGGELAAGIQAGNLALLPGLIYLESGTQKIGLSGSLLLMRPGGLAMGFSVSTLRGIGFKVVAGL